jgi:hypothetical protein
MKFRNRSPFGFFIPLLCLLGAKSSALSFDVRGQISGWAGLNIEDSARGRCGARYIPDVLVDLPLGDRQAVDAELSLVARESAEFSDLDRVESEGSIEPYRLWLRLSGSQFEARVGLQKISFGSASLFRPLMWFDDIDPRDPLQLTGGVYGALFRYYFLNNMNIWVWGLYGNHDPKGWEVFTSDSGSIEYGGRLQVPLGSGEIALSAHHRRLDLRSGPLAGFPVPDPLVPENRAGIDGKWDLGVGLWFEASILHQDSELLPLPYRRTLALGLDYTFGLGNGLYALCEFFSTESAEDILGTGEGTQFSAFLVRYSLGLFDDLSGIFYYDWTSDEFYRFAQFQRTFDRWSVHLAAFWNPEATGISALGEMGTQLAGSGAQLMIVYHH